MKKLLSVLFAAMFAVASVSAFAASHAGAQDKMEKNGKMEKKEAKKKPAKKKAAKKAKAGKMEDKK